MASRLAVVRSSADIIGCVSGNGAPGVICSYTNIRSCLWLVLRAKYNQPTNTSCGNILPGIPPETTTILHQVQFTLCRKPSLWESGVRNVYVSFRENITQWGRKKFMAGWLHLYAVGLAGLDRIVRGRIAYGIDPDK